MFTGIVTGLGVVRTIELRRGGGARLTVRPASGRPRFAAGESVCVSGVCLTALRAGRDLTADLSPETLRRSTLKALHAGARVNLERALRWGDRLSGHFVMGHVDGVARVLSVRPSGGSWTMTFSIPRGLARFVVPKGSVCLDGVSLTVASRRPGCLTVAVVPETHRRTTLGRVAQGDSVNFEADVFARYGFRGIARAGEAAEADPMILFESSPEPLARAGEEDVGGRRIAGRFLPYSGEAGAAPFRFDPIARRFAGRRAEAAVAVGPPDAELWRAASSRLPPGPLLVGPGSVAEEVRGAYRAAAEGASPPAARSTSWTRPTPASRTRWRGRSSWRPSRPTRRSRFLALAAARARGAVCGVLFPLIPGWTAEEDAVEALLSEAVAAGARSATPIVPEADGEARRAIVEARSVAGSPVPEGFFGRIHHREWVPLMGERLAEIRRRCAERGLAVLPPRPAGQREPRGNAAVSSRLEERAELEGLPEHRAASLRAAVRWIDESGRDLAAVAREGNFRRVFPFDGELAAEAEAAFQSRTMTDPAGIYVHLPYCASRCGYCAFVVTTDGASRERYLAALEREAALLAGEAGGAAFDAIYLGGGTPSLLPPAAIARLLAQLRARFHVLEGAEITLEANPEDVTPDAPRAWIDAGINRVSVGVQSLADPELAAVGRRHDANRARAALALLEESGLSTSGDLILGLPFQTPESFAGSLAGLCDAGVSHVSVYLLETEKSRIIEEDRRAQPERYLADDAQADLWLAMGETLAARGFLHYEISNWALDGP